MAIQVNTASGSMTLTAEDGVGNANVEIPRAGFPTQIVSASDGEAITGTDTAKFGPTYKDRHTAVSFQTLI